ncbi:hypothetical protein XENTR_v10001707 [Xenopus tropicalis]|nr:hypothetical protein XENTR_v10001707 [Xenopus tropicalis]
MQGPYTKTFICGARPRQMYLSKLFWLTSIDNCISPPGLEQICEANCSSNGIRKSPHTLFQFTRGEGV